VLTAWAHWSGQPEWAWPDQLGPVGRPLTLSLTRSRPNPNPLWRSRIADDSLVRFRRAPPPPYGAIAPPRQVLPSDRGDSWSSPPFVAIASEFRLVDLALKAWSALAGLAGASAPASWCLRWHLHRLIVWTASLQPRCRPLGAVLGLLAMSTMPLLAVTASGRWLPCHNRGYADNVTAMTFFLASLRAHLWVRLLLPCLCVHVVVAWPASQACLPIDAAPCLSLCCCPRASMLVTTYCYY
jgi:hypothetical protein